MTWGRPLRFAAHRYRIDVRATYGPAASGDTARTAALSCNVTVFDAEIACVAGAGVGEGHAWVVEVGALRSRPSTNTTRYRAPNVTRVEPMVGPAGGGTVITLSGVGFGAGANPGPALPASAATVIVEGANRTCAVRSQVGGARSSALGGTVTPSSWVGMPDPHVPYRLHRSAARGRPRLVGPLLPRNGADFQP